MTKLNKETKAPKAPKKATPKAAEPKRVIPSVKELCRAAQKYKAGLENLKALKYGVSIKQGEPEQVTELKKDLIDTFAGLTVAHKDYIASDLPDKEFVKSHLKHLPAPPVIQG